MGTTWERIFPPLVRDGNVTTFTPSTPGTHYNLIDEGMKLPDDSDFIFASVGDKQDRFRIPTGLTKTGTIKRIRIGFRYSSESLPITPAMTIDLFAGGSRWGSVVKLRLNSGGGTLDRQAVINIEPGRTTDDWNDAGTRLLWFTAKAWEPGYVDPPEYEPGAE